VDKQQFYNFILFFLLFKVLEGEGNVTVPLMLVGWITISVSGLLELSFSRGLDGLGFSSY
jgi:hypothetical protein